MCLYSFYATLHARSSDVAAGHTIELRGLSLTSLDVPRAALAQPFGISFEVATTALARLPRLYCEPDGSFVWVSSASDVNWQLDGNLYDRQNRLLFVDLKGTCPPTEFDQLLAALDWPGTPVMFQLVREGVLLGEEEFRRYAAAS